jgi:hypothetical protein
MIAEPLDLLNRSVALPTVQEYLGGLGPVVAEQDDQGGHDCVNVMSGGLSLIIESGLIHVVFLYVLAADGFSAYKGPLPLGLRPDDSQRDVRRKLGQPQFERSPEALKTLYPRGPMDRFDLPEFSVAVDYDVDCARIGLVTIMLAVAVPNEAHLGVH